MAIVGAEAARASATGRQRATLPHMPALDGLRGVAVLLVLLFHTNVLTGGWLGVEVFFVLSGYLITSLLILESDSTSRIDLVAFWRRRARRLLPGLVVLLGVVALFARGVSTPEELPGIRRDVIGALTYSSNWISIFHDVGYWDAFTAPSPLAHAWSLAVEEQFYLLFPLVALLCLRSPRARRWWIPLLAGIALVWQIVAFVVGDLNRAYLGTDTRAFGILAGACVAVFGNSVWRSASRVAALVACGVVTVSAIVLDGTTPGTFRGPFQLVTIATAVLLVSVRNGDPVITKLFGVRTLQCTGRWSYGLYLYHWPIKEWVRRTWDPSTPLLMVVVFALSYAAAAVSHRFVEQPIRQQGLRAFGVPRLTSAVATVVALAALGSATIGARSPREVGDIVGTPLPVSSSDVQARVDGIVVRPPGRPYRILLVGDSVGDSLLPSLSSFSSSLQFDVQSRAAPSCSYDREPTGFSATTAEDPACVAIVEQWAADVDRYRPDVVLFVYGSWSSWFFDGRFRSQCDEVLAERVNLLYEQALEDLSAAGATVVFVSPAYWRAAGHDDAMDDAYDCTRANMREFVAAHSEHAMYVDIVNSVCSARNCESTAGGKPVRPDGLHYSGIGADIVVIEVLRQIIEPPAGGWPELPSIVLPGDP